jgi:hypothetical protein
MLLGVCAFSLGAHADSAWACEPPPADLASTLITFEGIAVGVEENESEFGPGIAEWTFQVEPPVAGLLETATVAIQRSDAGDAAACEVAGPDLVVGDSYRVTAGQYPGQPVLNVSLYVGSYSKIASPPGAEVTVDSTAIPVETVAPRAPDQRASRRPVWPGALAGVATVIGVVAVKRRSRRNRSIESTTTTD